MRMIDADALIDFIDCGHLRNPLESCFSERDVVDMIESRPTIDVAPVVRGEWIYSRTQSEFAVSKCSACGKEQFSISHVVKDGKYCPNCGAKMEDKS